MRYSRLHIHRVARFGLAFLFFYHGLVPKLLGMSRTEVYLVELHNLSLPVSLVSNVAGVLEIVLALLIGLYHATIVPVYIAAALLFGLLIDVAFVAPHLLGEAFNPVTTNVLGLLLCYLVVVTQAPLHAGVGRSNHNL
ncbi:MAG: DoxX-like family protein [Oleiphilaceae bacterium]|nr:DoxX-like family protein [Oleiphilaceae bacterium]